MRQVHKKRSSMSLCIASPSFNVTSETFIRDHVRLVAPGATILLCQDNSGQLGCPVLPNVDSWPIERLSKLSLVGLLRSQWRRYFDPGLSAVDRDRVRAFFSEHHTKAVLAEFGPMGCLLARACDDASVPMYVHFHGYDASLLLRDAFHVRNYRALFARAAGIIVPSRFLADNLLSIGCPEKKLSVVSCGVDAQRFKPAPRGGQRILAVGRLVEKKAPNLTIEAFARITPKFPQAHLDIVGDGPLALRCRELICERGLSERVTLHGVQESDFIAKLLQQTSLFVQHSVVAPNGDAEGLPVSILEAMASALPVVSTRHSGIQHAVVDNVTGRLVDEHDVNAMATAMCELLNDPGRAATLGAAGRERVLAHFTQEKIGARLRDIMGLS
jgi:glycosyltransferase involved in cell wall biosynthesis